MTKTLKSTTLTTAALSAAAIALTLGLSAPALARGGDAIERKARQAFGNQVQTVELGSRQKAESGSGAFFDVNHSQTVETSRLKKRRFKQ